MKKAVIIVISIAILQTAKQYLKSTNNLNMEIHDIIVINVPIIVPTKVPSRGTFNPNMN